MADKTNRQARLAPQYHFLLPTKDGAPVDERDQSAAQILQDLIIYLRTEGAYYPTMPPR